MSKEITPMMRQYRRLKTQYPDALLFFRLGDFYEMFEEDAEVGARELELTLTGRDGGGRRIPMCGVPYHSAESHLARLIEKGYKVAICEQMEDPAQSKGLVEREIVRVVTPGTLLEPQLLDDRRNNYLVALAPPELAPAAGMGVALATVDASTGEFRVTEFPSEGGGAAAIDELVAVEPAEILLPESIETSFPWAAELARRLPAVLTWRKAEFFAPEGAAARLAGHFGSAWQGFGLAERPLVQSAAGALLAYLAETQKGSLGQITTVQWYSTGETMPLDPSTRRNLELTRRILDGSRAGTLLSVLDETCTAMGARTLRQWVERPLIAHERAEERLAAVALLVEQTLLRADVRDRLKGMYDLERLAGRVGHGTANARDLVNLRETLSRLPALNDLLATVEVPLIQSLRQDLTPMPRLTRLLDEALVDDPPLTINEGGLIRQGYHPEVDRLRKAGSEGKEWIARLEATERERTGIKSLKVGFNKVFGFYLEVTRANLHLVPDDYQRKQTLANAERFITEALKVQEEAVLGAEERLAGLERELFQEVRHQVAREVAGLQRAARALARLDALASLAEVAVRRQFVRPSLVDEPLLQIRAGRHPVLEAAGGEEPFVPNDTQMGPENRFLLITGPNMAGKSTYMRQVALIVLMAQMGSFVPADEATIGVVDRIFTRVGAADDLSKGQSTFMVEMTEVANILHNATPKSLVLLDEVGRGTSTYDGLAIAWAVSEYLHTSPQLAARTLFATHYHELTQLENRLQGLTNYTVAVRERGEEITFLRKIVRGSTDRSYGIHVARLAGLPDPVIGRALELLSWLEGADQSRSAGREVAVATEYPEDRQLSLFASEPHPVVAALREVEILQMTPLEALNKLYELQQLARQEEEKDLTRRGG